MSSKFLSSDSSTNLSALQDGTFELSVASASVSDLTPSLPVKTNTDKKLVSGLIELADIDATLVTNPFVGTLKASDFETDNYLSAEVEFLQIAHITNTNDTPDETTISGTIKPGDMKTDLISDAGANVFIQLDATDINFQSTNLTWNSAPIGGGAGSQLTENLDLNGFDITGVGGTTLNGLESEVVLLTAKTQNIEATLNNTNMSGMLNMNSVLGNTTLSLTSGDGNLQFSRTEARTYGMRFTTLNTLQINKVCEKYFPNNASVEITIYSTISQTQLFTPVTIQPTEIDTISTADGTYKYVDVNWKLPAGDWVYAHTVQDGLDPTPLKPVFVLPTDLLFIENRTTASPTLIFPELAIVQPSSWSGGMFEFTNDDQGTITTSDLSVDGNFSTPNVNDLTPIGGKYSQTGSDIIIANTATETSILNSGFGSWDFNTFSAGDSYHLRCSGTIETDAKDQELQLQIKLGATVFHTTSYIALDDVKDTHPWELELDFSFRVVGLSGDLQSNSQFTYNKDNSQNDFRGWSTNDSAVIDTTVPQTLTASATWLAAAVGNIFITKQFIITKTY